MSLDLLTYCLYEQLVSHLAALFSAKHSARPARWLSKSSKGSWRGARSHAKAKRSKATASLAANSCACRQQALRAQAPNLSEPSTAPTTGLLEGAQMD